MDNKEITIDDVRKWKQELQNKKIKSIDVSFNLPQGHIGNGIYRIADGCLTNKAGWEQFKKALIEKGYNLPDKINKL